MLQGETRAFRVEPVMKPSHIGMVGGYDRNFEVGDIVQHFKGGLYIIEAFGTNTETGENVVIYKSLTDGRTWVRPKEMFIGETDKDKYPDLAELQPYRLVKVRVEYV